MNKKTRRTFSPEFRLETAQLVLDQGYTHDEAAKAMGVSFSTVGRWVKQLRQERDGNQIKQAPMTSEQIEIRELKKRTLAGGFSLICAAFSDDGFIYGLFVYFL